ncbi:hypothetical protein CDL12_23009 [Handroanthus impetiginosus]|uniref:Uncharacterized protein n=1 Tax=Handroanthus impetiginosus TaxID=429701 RepID=A0A2G9GGX8_9LAMI|nr:hypothetical protein CDL12_23009 [Handroanthus impetiginosus]
MEKQERRRKIISRGNDRMALITGRIQTLDQDPFAKSSSFSTPRREPPPPVHARSSSEPSATNEEALFQDEHRHGGNDAPDTVTRHDNDEEVYKGNDSAYRVSPLRKLDKKEVATLTSENANLRERPSSYFPSSTALKEINSSIISSEDTRAICSVVLAILVILSHIHLPHDVVKPKSLIAYKPLYVVFLTDVFLVAAKMAPHKQQIRKVDTEPKLEKDGQNLDGAVKWLELGLVLYEAICALFIDCSCCLVIVICGLSLL